MSGGVGPSPARRKAAGLPPQTNSCTLGNLHFSLACSSCLLLTLATLLQGASSDLPGALNTYHLPLTSVYDRF